MTPRERAEAFIHLQAKRLRKGQDTIEYLLADLEDMARTAAEEEREMCARVADRHLTIAGGAEVALKIRTSILSRTSGGLACQRPKPV